MLSLLTNKLRGFESRTLYQASLAQMAEHRTLNPGVAGSSPAGGTKKLQSQIWFADDVSRKSFRRFRACGFESRLQRQTCLAQWQSIGPFLNRRWRFESFDVSQNALWSNGQDTCLSSRGSGFNSQQSSIRSHSVMVITQDFES